MLDRERLEQIVHAVADRLDGEWLLVGGAVVALWLEPRRVTEDIDLIGLAGSNEERLGLMQLAADLGLPIEAVNSAADYFVRQILDWRDQVEVFHSGARSTIYRPTPTLFLLLKIRRLSEQDLEDCAALLRHADREGEAVDALRVMAALDALPVAETEALDDRRQRLRALLSPP